MTLEDDYRALLQSLTARGFELDPEGDHRMAFLGALLGLVVEGVRVRGPGCVAKSWPGFWSELSALGLRVDGR